MKMENMVIAGVPQNFNTQKGTIIIKDMLLHGISCCNSMSISVKGSIMVDVINLLNIINVHSMTQYHAVSGN